MNIFNRKIHKLFFALSTILILVWPASFSTVERDRLYIWNVGQGSWSTLITASRCYHFDMGGEFFVHHSALAWCLARPNILFLSHLDSDHISFISRTSRIFRSLCLANADDFSSRKMNQFAKKLILIRALPSCPLRSMSRYNKTSIGGHREHTRIRKIMFHSENEPSQSAKLKTPNDLSQIFTLDNKWLFTGDSTQKAERLWAQQLSRAIHILIVGHHGSRTSTSDFLLQNLTQLKMAIVSARRKKYGHPHTEVVARLRQNKTPLLTTEQWGHIIFEL